MVSSRSKNKSFAARQWDWFVATSQKGPFYYCAAACMRGVAALIVFVLRTCLGGWGLTPPPVPRRLQIARMGARRARISWEQGRAPACCNTSTWQSMSYELELRSDTAAGVAGAWELAATCTADAAGRCAHAIDTLVPGGIVACRVRCVNGTGPSARSSTALFAMPQIPSATNGGVGPGASTVLARRQNPGQIGAPLAPGTRTRLDAAAYVWSQTPEEVELVVPVGDSKTRGKDVKVEMRPDYIEVKNAKTGTVVLAGDLWARISVQMSSWELQRSEGEGKGKGKGGAAGEDRKEVLLTLQKTKKTLRGESMWPCVLRGHDKIDVKLIDGKEERKELESEAMDDILAHMKDSGRRSIFDP